MKLDYYLAVQCQAQESTSQVQTWPLRRIRKMYIIHTPSVLFFTPISVDMRKAGGTTRVQVRSSHFK